MNKSGYPLILFLFFVMSSQFIHAQPVTPQERNFSPSSYTTLQNCIDAASVWGTNNNGTGVIVFSGKTYNISGSLNLGSNIRFQGTEVGAKTMLNYTGPQAISDKDFTGVLSIAANKTNITIANIDFTRVNVGQEGSGFSGVFKTDVAIKVQNPVRNIRVVYCKVTGYSALYESVNMAKWSDNLEIGNCEAVNNQAYFSHIITTKNINFHDNVIEQKNVGNSFIHAGAIFRGIQDSYITNNKLNQNGGGRAFNGLYFESVPAISEFGGLTGGGASNINLTITGNKISRTKEEGILIERCRYNPEYNNMADVVSATATTLTKAANSGYGARGIKTWTTNCWQDLTVIIVNGKGIGQIRQVLSNTDNKLTIENAWTEIPDSTSRFVVTYHTNNVLIDNNTINDTGKASIAPYMCCGTTVSNNIMNNCMNHMWDTSTIEMMCTDAKDQFGDDDGVLWPNYNNVISGNTIAQQHSMIGIRVGNTNFNSDLTAIRHGVSTYNIRIENNNINMLGANNGPNGIDTDISGYSGSAGIVVESASAEILRKVVIQNNTISNAKYGIWIGAQFEGDNCGKLQEIGEYKNTFTLCTINLYLTEGQR